ncbi:MAG: bifunctional non-ous end joining protein LigD [Gaiellaceae bacterium]|nr:bifunctional non-ous end joining protein LigD [Gaiellaceae bacterium]
MEKLYAARFTPAPVPNAGLFRGPALRQARQVAEKLREYNRKRDPKQTPEPFSSKAPGSESAESTSPIFVVQRHDARRLHYDFRLELGGALASWAVPKGVPLEPGQRALAVHVEDHPLDYARFEGEIPAGNYGAGTVEIWDSGTFELLEEKKDGGLTVRLHGTRLEGTWTLVPAKLDGDPKNWLLIRKRDEGAPRGEVRNDYRPMLATLADELPAGGDWLYEVKWDGYRALGYVRGGEARLVSRNENDLTARFPEVAKALAKAARSPECVVDGEVCALDERGRPSFSAMQQGKQGTPLVYAVFDVLEIDGVPVLDLPLTERRERLEQLLDLRQRTVQISGFFEDGEGLLEAAVEQGLEGVMAKRPQSRYVEGKRTRDWLKIKTHGREEFVICGWTKGQGKREGRFGALVLGTYRGDELHWVGNCGTGFTERDIDALLAKLEPLRTGASPFPVVPKMPKVRKGDVTWVEPKLVCEVRFAEWTHDGHLRAPSFQGLRDDKPARAVHREQPVEKREGRVKLSNLDKVFWPDEGITKGDLLDYYRAVAPAILPHLRDRPFTMRRYPDGAFGKAFFQKDAPKHMPEWIPTFRAHVSTRDSPPRKKWIEAPIVNDEDALLWMVNMGCIDMNVWYSRVEKPDRPDFVLFDLDPSPDVGFKETIQVALLVKEALDALGLESFAKTSSADGMHVLVPVERRYTFDDTREFSEIVAGAIARTNRGLATTEWSKARRRGVLIDSNQNGEGKTIASVYSVRPRAGAPVSTPLRWDEVHDGLDPSSFTMEVVLERVRAHGDLFAGVLKTRQRLDKALAALR